MGEFDTGYATNIYEANNNNMKNKESKQWFVYILRCADNSLYTGISTDVARREKEHNKDKLGAKYTRARRPVFAVYQEKHPSRSEATKREIIIKKMSKKNKEILLDKYPKKIG